MTTAAITTWMGVVASERGPRNYTQRLLLLAIGTRMLVEGRARLRLTLDDLQRITGLSRNWLIANAGAATRAGWLRRARERGAAHGRGWRAYWYEPSVPAEIEPPRFHVATAADLHHVEAAA